MKTNMKKLLVIVMALLPSLSILTMNPSGIKIVPDEPDDVPIVPHPGGGHEPRFRSVVQDPECYHYDGVVYIYADSTVTFISASITRIGDNLTWTGSDYGNTLTISASAAIGVYRLELTLSDGRLTNYYK